MLEQELKRLNSSELHAKINLAWSDSSANVDPFILKIRTPEAWGAQAVSDLATLMSDHAWCERKASGNCLSLLSAHVEHPELAEPMIRLAREELEHFHLVFNHMNQRGFQLLVEKQDHYVRALRKLVRSDSRQLMDRLLVAAVIEARSCERLGLIAKHLPLSHPGERELVDFYLRLTKAEARHFLEFVNLSVAIFGPDSSLSRLDEILDIESREIVAAPWACAVH